VTRTTVYSALNMIVASIIEAAPRVLVLSAPPGYGKIAAVRAFADDIGRRFVPCDLEATDRDSDLAWTMTQALSARDEGRAARSAADRLAQRRDVAEGTSRDAVRREWAIDAGPEVFTLRDPHGSLTSPRGAELFAELLGAFPASRSIALVTRSPLPPALRQAVDRERTAVLGTADLAFRAEDSLRAAREAGLSVEHGRLVHEICDGWPLVTTLLLNLLRQDDPAEVLESAATVPKTSLLAFGAHRAIARLPADVRDAVTVTTILRSATHLQLVRVLGDQCDDAVFAKLARLPFAEVSDDRVAIHPEIRALLRLRFAPLVAEIYERTLRVLTGDGAYVDAARVAIDAGDANRAAAIIDAAPPYTAAPVPIGAYEKIVDRLDRGMITQYPNIWIATIPYRSFSVDAATYVREAETIHFCMPPAASPDQRAAILMLLASAYVNFGRVEEADTLVTEALAGFAREEGRARAAILNFAASVRGIDGRFTVARSLAAEAAGISSDAFGENQVLLYIDAHEAAYRGKQDRVAVILDELLRRRKGQDLPLYRAHAAISAAIFSWVNGDDERFRRYVNAMEDAVTPGIDAMFGPVIDAAHGHPVRFSHEEPWPSFVALAQLYRVGSAASDEEALSAADAAAVAADLRRDPYLQTLAHTAIYVLERTRRESEAAILTRLAASIESAELQAAVAGLVAGDSAGMLEPFVRRVSRQTARRETHTSLELLSGRVLQDHAEVRLTEKEFELLALLASTRGAVSRDRIGESLWDHLEPEEWRNNFKVTVHRIRKKLQARDTIVADGGGYRLAPTVGVDLRRVEALVREHSKRVAGDATRSELRSVVDTFRSGAAARYERYVWGQQLLARISDAVCRAGIMFALDAHSRGLDDDVLWATDRIREIDAFNETACELTMRVLIGRGDVDGARREYQRYTAALANELGATPSDRLIELVRSAT
jgi:DNA-binding SARP family transcriptional activator